MDTASLARHITAKQLSPVEVLDAVLDRLDRLDPTLHIFATVMTDHARQDAKRIETDLAAGVGGRASCRGAHWREGPDLHQRDPNDVRVARLRRLHADEDDVVVERIKAAGAIVIGKTQVPEFGYSGTGQTPLAEPGQQIHLRVGQVDSLDPLCAGPGGGRAGHAADATAAFAEGNARMSTPVDARWHRRHARSILAGVALADGWGGPGPLAHRGPGILRDSWPRSARLGMPRPAVPHRLPGAATRPSCRCPAGKAASQRRHRP